MAQKAQSGDKDRVEHKANDMERFFSLQEIFYNSYIRPAIKRDVSDEFHSCMKPFSEKLRNVEKKLNVRTAIFVLLIMAAGLIIIMSV